jgi:hypothetical protein
LDVEHGEKVEKDLDRLIERRQSEGGVWAA